MGYYINPQDCSKEAWLLKNGTPLIAGQEPKTVISSTNLPVCLVDNGMFTAAAVGYNSKEVAAFSNPFDARMRTWFVVPRQALIEVGAIPENI